MADQPASKGGGRKSAKLRKSDSSKPVVASQLTLAESPTHKSRRRSSKLGVSSSPSSSSSPPPPSSPPSSSSPPPPAAGYWNSAAASASAGSLPTSPAVSATLPTTSSRSTLNSLSFPPSGSADGSNTSHGSVGFGKIDPRELSGFRERTVKSGALKKKGTWMGMWSDYYYRLEGELLMEFKRRSSHKSRKVFDLAKYGVREASKLCGHDNTFGLFALKESRDPVYFLCPDAKALRDWLRVLRLVCGRDMDNLGGDKTSSSSSTTTTTAITSSNHHNDDASSSWNSFLEALNDGAVLADAAGVIVAANGTFCAGYHYRHAELIGQPVTVLMEPAMAKLHDGFIRRYLERGYGDFIGSARVQRVKNGLGVVAEAEISLGELQRGGDVFFLARFRALPAADAGGKSRRRSRPRTKYDVQAASDSDDDELPQMRAQLERIVSSLLSTCTSDLVALLGQDMQATLSQLQDERKKALKNERLISKLKSRQQQQCSPAASLSSASVGAAPSMAGAGHVDQRIVIDSAELRFGKAVVQPAPGRAGIYLSRIDGWQCVCKELSLQGMDAGRVEAIESEIGVLLSLPRHRNLVQLHFHERNGSTIRIFVSRHDTTLRQIVRQQAAENNHFGRAVALKLLLDVAKGIAVMHRAGIAHCDLVPDNVLADYGPSGDIARLVVGDFDCAQRVSRKAELSAVGYPLDVLALGLVFYEILTLTPPNSPTPTIDAAVLPPSLASLVPLCQTLMAPSPTDRPTIADVVQQLAAEIVR